MLSAGQAQKQTEPIAIYIMGPTASGKTDLALRLCKQYPCDIISVDSAMVYRGLDIGTAKPDQSILSQFPHKLIDLLDPADAYSAAQFCQDAIREMRLSVQAGRIPLLVGGTMLYFRALQNGLADLPVADTEIRQRLQSQLEQSGLASLYNDLKHIDPQAAARIHANDPQRIMRALEIYYASGETMSEQLARQTRQRLPYRVIKFILTTAERASLHDRIEHRFKAMLAQGFVDEVRALWERGDLSLDKPAIRAVGYRQIWQFLQSKYSYDEMVEQGIIATRQLAKRQLTWLRAEPDGLWYNAENLDMADINDRIERCIT